MMGGAAAARGLEALDDAAFGFMVKASEALADFGRQLKENGLDSGEVAVLLSGLGVSTAFRIMED